MKGSVDTACLPLDDIGAKHITTGQYIIMSTTMKEMSDSQMRSLFITIAAVILILTAVM
jgi:hypothetical protein